MKMTTGPLDPAAGGGWLLAGHADRERVIETLKDAFVDGRLTRDEFDARTVRALIARTYADLAVLTADIPLGQAAVRPAPAPPAPSVARRRQPARVRRRPLARATVQSGGCVIIAAVAMWLSSLADPGATPTPYDAWAFPLVLVSLVTGLVALGIFGFGVAASLEQRRSRGKTPPPPCPGGHAAPNGDPRNGTDPDPGLPRVARTAAGEEIWRMCEPVQAQFPIVAW
jgi:hypothetical protein